MNRNEQKKSADFDREAQDTWNLKPSRKRSKTKIQFSFTQLLILWLIFLLGINFVLYFNKRKVEYKNKKQQIVQLQQEINQLKLKQEDLYKEIYYLKTKEGVESIARERLGLVKPGELSVVVIPSNKSGENESLQPTKSKKPESKLERFLNYWKEIFHLGKKNGVRP